MISITKNTLNKVALTLSEKASSPTSDFLLELINDIVGTPSKRVIALYDTGGFPRANIFEIQENATEDLANSIVCLSPTGQWTYNAYEMTPGSPRNMDPAQAIKIVETGICLVNDPGETKNNFFDEDENKNSPVFEG